MLEPRDARAVIHLAVARYVELTRARPGAKQVAYLDQRTDEEKMEYLRLRAQVIGELEGAGFDDLAALVDVQLWAVGFAYQTPDVIRDRVTRMLEIGLPTAVFVAPLGAAQRTSG